MKMPHSSYACGLELLAHTRPLQWFADESFDMPVEKRVKSDLSSAIEKEWEWPTTPAHMHKMNGASSFLQMTTGGNPLECDCERVKCNCVKRCECGLPASAQNKVAAQFLEIASATGKQSAPLWVDVDTNECFLSTGVSVGQDTHHMLDCECDKVKCNCVKHCECSLPSGAAGSDDGTHARASSNLLQLDQGAGEPETKVELSESKVETEKPVVAAPEKVEAPKKEKAQKKKPAPKGDDDNDESSDSGSEKSSSESSTGYSEDSEASQE